MSDYTHGSNVEDVLMDMHDRSLSSDPDKAAEGRAGKAMSNMLSTWLDEETNKRGTDLSTIILCSYSMAVSIIASTVATICQDEGNAADLLEKMKGLIIQRYDGVVDNLRNIAAQKKEAAK